MKLAWLCCNILWADPVDHSVDRWEVMGKIFAGEVNLRITGMKAVTGVSAINTGQFVVTRAEESGWSP